MKGNLSKKTPMARAIEEHAAGTSGRHGAAAIDYGGGSVAGALGSLEAASGALHAALNAESGARESAILNEAGERARDIADLRDELGGAADAHAQDRANPHGVTKEQLGLGNVKNVAQAPETHAHHGADIINGTITREKLGFAIEPGGGSCTGSCGGFDEAFAHDMRMHVKRLYALSGIRAWDGGWFGEARSGAVLDGNRTGG